jgi:hypothetical protein
MPHKRIRAWPKTERGERLKYLPVQAALPQPYPTDAHFAAYSLPELPRRLGVDALRDPDARARVADGVPMVLAVFDVDCAEAHQGDPSSVDAWWLEELGKLQCLGERHPGGFVYRTRGGYRIVYRLPAPTVLRDDADAQAWTARYCAWVAYLKREFRIRADSACKDWTRLFRLPRATRDEREGPEQREMLGDPTALGAWTCEPTAADLEAARKVHRRKAPRRRKARSVTAEPVGEGVLFHLLKAAGWLGEEVAPGKWAVRCPNEVAHTGGERLDTSTVLYAPAAGECLGWLHCSHAHCAQQSVREVLAGFSDEEVEAARLAAGLAPRALPTEAQDEDDPRPTVYVPGAHNGEDGEYFEVGAHQFTKAVLEAIPADCLYRKDRVVGHIVGVPGHRHFRRLDEYAMRPIVDRHARLVLKRKDGRTGKPTTLYRPCSRDHAGLVLAAAAISPRVRELDLIVAYPVYRPGFDLAFPGYNANGRVFYDEHPDLVGLQPHREGALDVLGDLVMDFPLKDDASRENVYGLMLTLVLRPAIEGCVPFHLFMASLERTGKGRLIDTAGIAVTGHQVRPLQLTEKEVEREKRISSLLIAGRPVAHFDNIPGGEVMDSPALASLATAYPRWGGRLLGKSLDLDLPNRVVVTMSGNNVRAMGELCKRTVPIVLESKTPTPELRDDFVHADCLAHAASRRREVLAALLGLVESWRAAGMPTSRMRMGGFERWTAAVGGVLGCAGATAWMTNYRKWVSLADDAGADAEKLVREWARMYGERPITASEILNLARTTETFARVFTKPTVEGQRISLARRARSLLIDRPCAGWIVRRTESGSSSTYHLERGMA